MSKKPDPNALLCRRCGYVVDGLGVEANCPECGVDIAGSMPEARTGTVWQNCKGARSQLTNISTTITSPIRCFEVLRFDSPRVNQQIWTSVMIATGIPLGVLLLIYVGDAVEHQGAYSGSLVLVVLPGILVLVGFIFTLLLRILVFVEQRGLLFWGRMHGRRITKPIAQAICAEASTGWVVGGLLIAISMLVAPWMVQFSITHTLGPIRPLFALANIILPIASFFIGMLTFETLVYIGVLRCRYANEITPTKAKPAKTPNPTIPA